MFFWIWIKLIEQRSSIMGNINRIKNMYEAGSFNVIDVKCRLEILKAYIKHLTYY